MFGTVTRHRGPAILLVLALVAGLLLVQTGRPAKASVDVIRSTTRDASGRTFWATNHLVRAPGVAGASAAGADTAATGGEYLVVWAGDDNAGDTTGADV